MRKVALFGGAFDPPTRSHLKVAKSLLTLVDEVWLFPCYVSYYDKKMALPDDRLRMCQLACSEEKDQRIRTCDFEIRHKCQEESVEILEHFLEKYRGTPNKFYFVIGMDNVSKICTWGGFDRLKKIIAFIIVPRLGYEIDEKITWYLQPPHIYYKNLEPDDGSSTQVRKEIKQTGESSLVCQSVLDYIQENALYLH